MCIHLRFIYETVTWGMAWGYDVLMCDTDIVLFNNPFKEFARLPPCDFLASSCLLSLV